MKKIDAFDTIKRCETMFARFGFPETITVDNGRQFAGHEFKRYCDTNNIVLNETIPYWPQMNGAVERQNQSLLKRLRICQEEKEDWQEDLHKYLLMYRSTPHSTTLKSPAELMFNRNIRDKLPCIHQQIERDEELHDRDKVIENIETGTQYRRNLAHVTKVELDSTSNQKFSFSPLDSLPVVSSSSGALSFTSSTTTASRETRPVDTHTPDERNNHGKRFSAPNPASRQQPPRKRAKPLRYSNLIEPMDLE